MVQTHPRPNSVPDPIVDRPVRIRTEDGHQVIELPTDVRFEGETVYLSREATTGTLTIKSNTVPPRPRRSWAEIFAAFDAAGVPDDFLADRPLNRPQTHRNPFLEDDPE